MDSGLQPEVVTDLHACSLDPADLPTDQLIGYCGYVKNFCADLGTKNDSESGWNDYINFQKEIAAARISTFEPDAIDDDHTFENMDLTGENIQIDPIPLTYWATVASGIWHSYTGFGVTPFDIEPGSKYVKGNNGGVTPFDLVGGQKLISQNKSAAEPVLTA